MTRPCPRSWTLRARCLLTVAATTVFCAAAPIAAATATSTLRELPPSLWTYTHTWSLSSDDVLFGVLIDVDQLAGGDLAFTDGRLGQVLIVDRDGQLRRTLEVAGEGPGRLTRLDALCELPSEDLLLVQAWPGRGEVVDRFGEPVRSRRSATTRNLDGAPTWIAMASGYGMVAGVVAEVRREDPQVDRSVLRLMLLDPVTLEPGRELLRGEFANTTQMGLIDETVGYFPQRSWAIADQREVVVAPERERYLLEVHDRELGLVERHERPRRPVPRCRAEIERLKAGYTLEVNGQRQAITFVLHQTAEMIQGITALGPRTLLLQTAYTRHALPDGVTARYDLVDLKAGTVREVWLQVPHDAQADRLVLLPDGNLVVLTGAMPSGPGMPGPATDELLPPTIQFWTRQGGAR